MTKTIRALVLMALCLTLSAEDFFVVFRTPDASQLRGVGNPIGTLQSAATAAQGSALILLRNQRAAVQYQSYWISNRLYVNCPGTCPALRNQLAGLPGVTGIEPNRVYPLIDQAGRGMSMPQPQGIEWGVNLVGAPKLWSLGITGKGITVGVIDTGIDPSHPTLKGKLRAEKGFFDPTGICANGLPCDNQGHGTHVSGTIAGDDGQGNQIGVAPGVTLIMAKGCSSNSCSSNHLLAAAQWVMDPYQDGSGKGHADIVSNSWGGVGGDTWYQDAVKAWLSMGMAPVFAMGNNGPNCSTSSAPGNYPESFAIGAVDINEVIAGFSARGPSALDSNLVKPDVCAPGVNVRSSTPNGGYAAWSGTSMATPHVSGVIALLWSAFPKFKGQVKETLDILRATSKDLPQTQICGSATGRPNNVSGYGLVDAKAAFDKMGGAPPPPPGIPVIEEARPLARVYCPTTVTFHGKATDKDDGDISGEMVWYDNGIPFFRGSNPGRMFTCKPGNDGYSGGFGAHEIHAEVTNSAGFKAVSAKSSIFVEKLDHAIVIHAPEGGNGWYTAEFSGNKIYWFVDGQFVWSGSPAWIYGAGHTVRAEVPGIGEAEIDFTSGAKLRLYNGSDDAVCFDDRGWIVPCGSLVQ